MRLGFSRVGAIKGRFDLAIDTLDRRIESDGQQRAVRQKAGLGP
jgi:hypothetical protein